MVRTSAPWTAITLVVQKKRGDNKRQWSPTCGSQATMYNAKNAHTACGWRASIWFYSINRIFTKNIIVRLYMTHIVCYI